MNDDLHELLERPGETVMDELQAWEDAARANCLLRLAGLSPDADHPGFFVMRKKVLRRLRKNWGG